MSEGSEVRRRFQCSLRSLLIVTGLLALFLVPVASWVRQREQVRRAHEEVLRSLDLERQYRAELNKRKPAEVAAIDRSGPGEEPRTTPTASADATAQIKRLQRENDELRNTVESLRGEIQRLKSQDR